MILFLAAYMRPSVMCKKKDDLRYDYRRSVSCISVIFLSFGL